jgi:predicted AAA+ superfamily ATPase
MDIFRQGINKLNAWKNKPNRKPLVLQGARQVGKTWLMNQFGKEQFESVAYFNFEEQPELKPFFEETKDIGRILSNLSLVSGKPIDNNSTLIIFDEIQECNDALNSLKYFCEKAPEYCVVSAGSLLGVAMSSGNSFPVGKVDFMTLYPLNFQEFLSAAAPDLIAVIDKLDLTEPIPEMFYNRLLEQFKRYFISGGMPEAVVALLDNQSIDETQEILQNILNAYALDFSKHAPANDFHKINYIWSSLPSQLSRENKKFLYQTVRPGARARDYGNALEWLKNAGLIYKIHKATAPRLPLSGYDDLSSFKVYMNDVGLLRRLSLLNPIAVAEGNRLFTEFKGALTENYILQSLIRQFEGMPRYWSSGNMAEVDFLIQHGNDIIPVEVKSDENIRSKSLSVFRKTFSPRLSLRFSLRNMKMDNGVLNIPLFLADYTLDLIHLNNSQF